MRITLSYFGEVTDTGELKLPGQKMRREIGKVFAGKRVEVTVKQKAKWRSSPQNRYYWGCLIPGVLDALIDAGNDLQQGNEEHLQMIHEFCKNKFLQNGIEIVNLEGEVEKLPPSTTRNGTIDQEEYHESIRRWAAEYLNYSIPLPNEQATIGFHT
jgi:hypothetical protein